MKITDLRCIQLEADATFPGRYFEDRFVRPTDYYEDFQARGWGFPDNLPREHPDRPGELRMRSRFIVVETDTGDTGIFGPIALTPAFMALSMKGVVIGQDPFATNRIWDTLYRSAVHGRKGEAMFAISAIWDLKGKILKQPVYKLLGGPVQTRLPCYISTLIYSTEPELVHKRAVELKEKGYRGQKWFFRYCPKSGREGFRKNVEMVRIAREAVGDDYDLMFDAWMSWDPDYTLEMARAIEKYHPLWLEEPLMPDKIDRLADVRAKSPVRISGAEHEYTRWGFHEIFKRGAVDIIQPDPMWAGGITETMNICTLASAYDITTIPHGESIAATVQVVAANPPSLCPMVENLERFNFGWQYFLVDPVAVVDGHIELDTRPGLGIVVDESRAERVVNVEFPDYG